MRECENFQFCTRLACTERGEVRQVFSSKLHVREAAKFQFRRVHVCLFVVRLRLLENELFPVEHGQGESR
ncbi:hypothetical protein M378DRAFT_162867, partial [Amanita muscaria Koide BX008]